MSSDRKKTRAFEIRPAVKSDAVDIAHVHVACWRETYAGIMPAYVLENLDVEARGWMWTKAIRDRKFDTFVCTETARRTIVGFACCGPRREVPEPYHGEFRAIYLLNSAQGQGIGRALMSRMGAALILRDLPTAALRVARDVPAARGFYEHLGGIDLGESSHEVDEFNVVTTVYGWPDLDVLL